MCKNSTKPTMESCKVKLSPQEIFDNKKLFSNKIHARVLKITEEVLQSFEKFKIVIEDKNVFLKSVNHYYHDLCGVIFNLRQIMIQIDDDDDKESARDLQDVIIELNKIVLVVQESLNLETEKLLIQLKRTVIDVGPQVEKLMKIIEYDNLHENKQNILDIQHDLVLSIEALKLYCQSSYLTYSELEGLLHEEIEKIKNDLIQIKTGHEHLTDDFLHYTNHSVQNIQNLLNYFRKQTTAENFPPDVANALKNADSFVFAYISDTLEAVVCDNPVSKILEVFEKCHMHVTKCSLEIGKAVQAAITSNIGKKSHQKLKELLIHIYIHGWNGLSGLHQSLEDAIMKR